jgi:two-component system NtrC family sensor kinase
MTAAARESDGPPAEDRVEAAAGLLLVDDEPAVGRAIRHELRAEEFPLFIATTCVEAMAILEREHIGVIVSDDRPDGVTFLRGVKDRWPNIRRCFIPKPWDPEALRLNVAASFEHYRLLEENQRLRALLQTQNRELIELNRSLEAKIDARTLQLTRAKAEWEQTFDAIVDPLAIVSPQYAVVRANLAYALRAGLPVDAVPGRPCHQLLAGRDVPCEDCPLPAALRGETPRGVDISAKGRELNVWAFPLRPSPRTRSQGDTPLSALGSLPIGDPSLEVATADLPSGPHGVCYYRDVTEERTLAGKLARTEKLAALGLFVGGVAHEINNPLGGILAFTQLLLKGTMGSSGDEEEVRALERIEWSALRAKRIIESLLSFAQGAPHLTQTAVDCGVLINEVVSAFNKDYGGWRLEVEVEIHPDTPAIHGDPALLHQLLRNLLQNAEDALPGDGGEIRIKAGPAVLNDAPAVRLEVWDNGSGIPAEHLPRIFDPFFTTKIDRKGTGLGLSICHRIVEQHGGLFEVQSEPGRGTTFGIALLASHPSRARSVRAPGSTGTES